jgi:hypothetical protein
MTAGKISDCPLPPKSNRISVDFFARCAHDRLLPDGYGAVLRYLVGQGVVGTHVDRGMSRQLHRLGDAQRGVECRDRLAMSRVSPEALPAKPELLCRKSEEMLVQVTVITANGGFLSPRWMCLNLKNETLGIALAEQLQVGRQRSIGTPRRRSCTTPHTYNKNTT